MRAAMDAATGRCWEEEFTMETTARTTSGRGVNGDFMASVAERKGERKQSEASNQWTHDWTGGTNLSTNLYSAHPYYPNAYIGHFRSSPLYSLPAVPDRPTLVVDIIRVLAGAIRYVT